MYHIIILCLVPHTTVCEDIAGAVLPVSFHAEKEPAVAVHTPRTVWDTRGIQNAAEHPVFRVTALMGTIFMTISVFTSRGLDKS